MKLMLFANFLMVFQFILIQGAEKEEGLVFDRFTRSLFQLPEQIPKNTVCDAWAVACPAETPEEKEFIKRYSFTRNGLFLRKIYNKGSNAAEVKKKQCKDPFKFSLTYNVRSLTFQFGFETYYDLTDAAYFHTHKFDDYKSPGEVAKSMTGFLKKAKTIVWKEYFRILKSAFDSDIRELWFDGNKRMGFAWIYLMKLIFTFSKKILWRIEYDISPNSRWPVLEEQCTDFSLGSEFYEDINLDKLYAKDETTLANLKIGEFGCRSNYNCFQKWLLVPLSQFRFGSSAPPVCSNMVTIPVWKLNGKDQFYLRKIDQYLYALFRYLGEPLHVIAGVRGENQFKKKRGWGKTTVYLDLDKKIIPIPRIIYKIVEYRLKNCQLEEPSCWYSVIIIIHNDPSFKPSDRLCPVELTKQWGWEGIVKDAAAAAEFIYVCPRTREIQKKLFGITLRQINVMNGILGWPLFILEDGRNIDNKLDIRSEVEKKLEEFITYGEDFDRETQKIMELHHRKFVNPESEELFSQSEAQAMGLDAESGGPREGEVIKEENEFTKG
ncbi:uncharacterized protein LOC135843374 [Planococcus citri]|uniref:uncharacterized protein LOC135843374 n=1 Tax=Planococcus citri TaxID=170843 RepID=UPI0031FA0958